ncbi:MAG: 50S ribosomal protein L5 [bacterium]
MFIYIRMNNQEIFRKKTQPTLQKNLGIKNINAVPKLEKVIVAIGIGSLATRKSVKDFDEFEKVILKITGQKARMIKSKKSISNFKLREGLPVMLQVTLRKQRAYDFVDRFVKLVLPRMRDFSGLSDKSFDNQANYSI